MTRVVLVHGSLSAASQWTRYADLLPDHDVVTIDLPGHGTRMGERFTTDAAIAIIAEAVEGTDEPVVLVGHSLGGYMAMVYAARNPGRLAGLALLGTSGDPKHKLAFIYSGFAWFSKHVNRKALLKARATIAKWLKVEQGDLPEDDTYAVLPDAWGAVFTDCDPAQLEQVGCPVLIVNGQFDQMRVSERKFSRLAGGAPVVTIPKASHIAPLTHKEQVATHLSEFIDAATARGAVRSISSASRQSVRARVRRPPDPSWPSRRR